MLIKFGMIIFFICHEGHIQENPTNKNILQGIHYNLD